MRFSGRSVPGRLRGGDLGHASAHGNARASDRLTTLYRLEDFDGNLVKWGISGNLKSRCSTNFLKDKLLIQMTSGSREQMLKLERWIVQRDPGPLNLEPWAGAVG
ncbi:MULTISPECIES: hypothetical protein [Microbacterium]|uniref:hypothetical protein n=1 Tax=Microbacterium TaxID=33882 RepID=UPI00146DD3B2|nr:MULTISPECIES: hypothetical protein [Microbacterium]